MTTHRETDEERRRRILGAIGAEPEPEPERGFLDRINPFSAENVAEALGEAGPILDFFQRNVREPLAGLLTTGAAVGGLPGVPGSGPAVRAIPGFRETAGRFGELREEEPSPLAAFGQAGQAFRETDFPSARIDVTPGFHIPLPGGRRLDEVDFGVKGALEVLSDPIELVPGIGIAGGVGSRAARGVARGARRGLGRPLARGARGEALERLRPGAIEPQRGAVRGVPAGAASDDVSRARRLAAAERAVGREIPEGASRQARLSAREILDDQAQRAVRTDTGITGIQGQRGGVSVGRTARDSQQAFRFTREQVRDLGTRDLDERLWKPVADRITRQVGSSKPQDIVDFYVAREGLPPIRVMEGVRTVNGSPIPEGAAAAVMDDGQLVIAVAPRSQFRSEAERIIKIRHEIEHHIDRIKHRYEPKVPTPFDREGNIVPGHHRRFDTFDVDYPHRVIVRDALDSGQEVPAQVLRDYPDLAAGGAPGLPSGAAPEGLPAKLTAIVRSAVPARAETAALRSEELGRRAARLGRAQATAPPTRAGFRRTQGTLQGELPIADFEVGLKLTPDDITEAVTSIRRNPRLQPFTSMNTEEAFWKVFADGRLPTDAEIRLLEQQFGPELAEALLSMRPLGEKVWRNLLDAWNMPRALMASADFSAPLRQALLPTVSRPRQSVPALVRSFPTLWSKTRADDLLQEAVAKRDKWGQLGRKLYLASPERSTLLSGREEVFMSRLVEKLPIIGPIVRASERGFTSYLNKLRADMFDKIASSWDASVKTQKDYDNLANMVNVLTGRGSLGRFERIAPELNIGFFAPRFAASRIQTPLQLLSRTPEVRKEVAREMAATVALGLTVLGAAKMAGADVEDDPRSSNFGKVKVGNTAIDFWGGYQQMARYISQIISGQGKTATTEVVRDLNRLETVGRLARSKASPGASLVVDWLDGRDFIGRPVEPTPAYLRREVADNLTPFLVQDVVEAVQDLGPQGIGIAAPAFFGAGTVTFESRQREAQQQPGQSSAPTQQGETVEQRRQRILEAIQ